MISLALFVAVEAASFPAVGAAEGPTCYPQKLNYPHFCHCTTLSKSLTFSRPQRASSKVRADAGASKFLTRTKCLLDISLSACHGVEAAFSEMYSPFPKHDGCWTQT